jgi:hypothetical protein
LKHAEQALPPHGSQLNSLILQSSSKKTAAFGPLFLFVADARCLWAASAPGALGASVSSHSHFQGEIAEIPTSAIDK